MFQQTFPKKVYHNNHCLTFPINPVPAPKTCQCHGSHFLQIRLLAKWVFHPAENIHVNFLVT